MYCNEERKTKKFPKIAEGVIQEYLDEKMIENKLWEIKLRSFVQSSEASEETKLILSQLNVKLKLCKKEKNTAVFLMLLINCIFLCILFSFSLWTT